MTKTTEYGPEVYFRNGEFMLLTASRTPSRTTYTRVPKSKLNNRQKHRIKVEQYIRTRCQLEEDRHKQAWTTTQFIKALFLKPYWTVNK